MTSHFLAQMHRLGGLKFVPADLTTHWEALRQLANDDLEAAVSLAQAGCSEFPSPVQLLAFVDVYRRDLPVPDEDMSRETTAEARTIRTPWGTTYTFDREWRYYCEGCSDTGLRSFWCADEPSQRQPWLTVSRCLTPRCERIRRGPPYGHEWVEACPCAATNPAVLRKKAQAAQVTRKQADR